MDHNNRPPRGFTSRQVFESQLASKLEIAMTQASRRLAMYERYGMEEGQELLLTPQWMRRVYDKIDSLNKALDEASYLIEEPDYEELTSQPIQSVEKPHPTSPAIPKPSFRKPHNGEPPEGFGKDIEREVWHNWNRDMFQQLIRIEQYTKFGLRTKASRFRAPKEVREAFSAANEGIDGIDLRTPEGSPEPEDDMYPRPSANNGATKPRWWKQHREVDGAESDVSPGRKRRRDEEEVDDSRDSQSGKRRRLSPGTTSPPQPKRSRRLHGPSLPRNRLPRRMENAQSSAVAVDAEMMDASDNGHVHPDTPAIPQAAPQSGPAETQGDEDIAQQPIARKKQPKVAKAPAARVSKSQKSAKPKIKKPSKWDLPPAPPVHGMRTRARSNVEADVPAINTRAKARARTAAKKTAPTSRPRSGAGRR